MGKKWIKFKCNLLGHKWETDPEFKKLHYSVQMKALLSRIPNPEICKRCGKRRLHAWWEELCADANM